MGLQMQNTLTWGSGLWCTGMNFSPLQSHAAGPLPHLAWCWPDSPLAVLEPTPLFALHNPTHICVKFLANRRQHRHIGNNLPICKVLNISWPSRMLQNFVRSIMEHFCVIHKSKPESFKILRQCKIFSCSSSPYERESWAFRQWIC